MIDVSRCGTVAVVINVGLLFSSITALAVFGKTGKLFVEVRYVCALLPNCSFNSTNCKIDPCP